MLSSLSKFKLLILNLLIIDKLLQHPKYLAIEYSIPIFLHYSGTGELIVTSQYEEIRIWQLKLKKEIRRQVVKNMTCNAVDLTRDGKTIISGMIKKIPSF